MAKTKTAKTTKGSRKSQPKMLGIKHYGGEAVKAGAILMRQHGSEYHPGLGVGRGKDHTLFALYKGVVKFYEQRGKRFISIITST